MIIEVLNLLAKAASPLFPSKPIMCQESRCVKLARLSLDAGSASFRKIKQRMLRCTCRYYTQSTMDGY